MRRSCRRSVGLEAAAEIYYGFTAAAIFLVIVVVLVPSLWRSRNALQALTHQCLLTSEGAPFRLDPNRQTSSQSVVRPSGSIRNVRPLAFFVESFFFVTATSARSPFRKWSFRKWSFREWSFREWSFREWSFRECRFASVVSRPTGTPGTPGTPLAIHSREASDKMMSIVFRDVIRGR